MAYVEFEVVGVTKAEIRNYAIDSPQAASLSIRVSALASTRARRDVRFAG